MVQRFSPLSNQPGHKGLRAQIRTHRVVRTLPAVVLALVAGMAVWWYVEESTRHPGSDLMVGLLMAAASAAEPLRNLISSFSPGDLYRRIVETDPECVKLLAADGRLLEMNPAGLSMIEAESLDQIVGRHIVELVVPEHRGRFHEHVVRVFEGESVEVEFDIVGLRGTRRTLYSRAVPLRDPSGRVAALLAISRDVTEMKRAQQALCESEERFRNLIETTNDWVWELNERLEFTYTSPQVQRLLGYEPEEILGRSPFLLMPPDEAAQLRARLAPEQAAARSVQLLEHRWRHKEGRFVLLEPSGVPYSGPGGQFGGYRGISRDITERRQVEETLRRAQERERQREIELGHVARLSAMGALMAGIAHELNQPLHTIKNYAEALSIGIDAQRSPQAAKWREWAQQITVQVERAGGIIRSLQAFCRSRELQLVRVDVGKLVQEVLDQLESEPCREGIRLETALAEPLPPIKGDPLQFQQVLLNLLRNACEAAAESAAGGRVQMSIGVEGGELVVRVSDNGPGLPPIDPQQLFEPFFTTKSGGLGMGLAISRVLVEAHGGTLRALPTAERGALFECRLPIATEDASV